MELKDRKLILNALPKFDLGLSNLPGMNFDELNEKMLKSGQFVKNSTGGLEPKVTASVGTGSFLKNNAGGIMNTAASALNFANTLGNVSKNNYSSDEMMGSGGTVQQNANGVGYTEQRVDEAGIQKQIDATAGAATMSGITSGMSFGASAGSLLGPIGGAIGGAAGALIGGIAGFFGGSKAKEEAERQKRIAINRTIAANTQNRETAYAIGLRNEFNRNNRTDESLSLFHAAKGKEGDVNPLTMLTYKKHVVNTAYGKMYAPQNAWVSDGEVIKSADGSLHRVKGGKNDTARAYLQTGDSVYSNKIINPETGNTIADDVASYAMAGQLDRLDMNLNVGRMMLYAGKRKGDVLPGYLGGTNKIWNAVKNIGQNLDLENVIPTVTAFTTAALRDAQAEGGLRAPKSFVANPYENDALQQLNSLHSDYYPVWAQNRELEARGKSAIAQSGGLSAGLKMLGYMGLANKTQQNNAAALFEHQGRENALRAQAANAALQAGQNAATRQQQAYQWDEDMLAKANAARLNMWETSAYDRQNALTQFFKNLWEKNQFKDTMALYKSQLKNDEAKTQAIIESLRSKNNPVTLTGVADNAAMISIDPETGGIRRIDPFSPRLLGGQLKNPLEGFKLPTTEPKKSTTVRASRKPTSKSYTVTNDTMGKQFASFVAKPLKKESKKATTQAKPTEDITTKSTLLSFVLAGGRNLISLSSNKDISPYSVVKQEEHKLKSKVGKSNASSFAENVSETVSKAYEDGQKKRKSQLKKQPAKQESKAGKSNVSSFFDALSKLYAEGLKRREKTLKEQRGY